MRKYLLEVIACSAEDARRAEAGGADRLELCARLDLRGVTPPADVTAAVCDAVSIPVRVMIRTNAGFGATEEELVKMEQQAQEIRGLRVEGLVSGFVTPDGQFDFPALDRVVNAGAPGWKLTLHNAFDVAAGDPAAKVEAVRHSGRVDHILTGAAAPVLRELCRAAQPAVMLIAGGGLTAANIPLMAAESCCREYHVGRAARDPDEVMAPVSEHRVRQLRVLLDDLAARP